MRSFLLFTAIVLLAADWPRFRGINGAGIGEAAPTKWTQKEGILWQVPVSPGNGSPIIVNEKLFLQAAAKDGSSRSLICLDAVTGKEVWTKTQSGTTAKTHKKSSLASSTPASDGERIYCCFWDGQHIALVAYDFKGNELWNKSLGTFTSEHGAGLSPMVHNGKVFLNYDTDEHADMMAFDAKSGDKLWEMKRKSYRCSYSTPMVRDLPGGGSEILDLSTAGLTAYDPASGKVNWESTFSWGPKPLRSVASPVEVDGMLIAATGDGAGDRFVAGITPGKDTKVAWTNKSAKLAPYVPCPVAVGKHLYWITDLGVMECINPATGKALWSASIFSANVSASPILVGETILVIDERGKAIAVKPDPVKYRQESVSDVGEGVIATPAVANGRLYIRSATTLMCIGK